MNKPENKNQVGNKDVGTAEKSKSPHDNNHKAADEKKLEQGLEESMAGSDPVAVTQPNK